MDFGYLCDDGYSTFLEIVFSIALGAAIGVLFAFDFIPGITTALWIAFGLAVLNLVSLAAGLRTVTISKKTPLARCLCCRGDVFLAGIIGTIITALVALSILLVSTAIPIIILIAFAGFFTALMFTEQVLILSCLISGTCPWSEE